MAANAATVVYAGLVNDSAAIETAIQTTTYDAAQTWVVVPTPGNACIILHVVSA
jgi:hypothetical protein